MMRRVWLVVAVALTIGVLMPVVVSCGQQPPAAGVDLQGELTKSGRLWIPPGVHELAEPLVVPSGGKVTGSGPASVLSFPTIKQGPCIVNAGHRDSEEGAENITLADFAIRGPDAGQPSGPIETFTQGIRLQKVRGCAIHGVTIRRVGFGIFGVGVESGEVSGCDIGETSRDGIHFVSYQCEGVDSPNFDRRPTRDLSITGNRVWGAGDDCIAVHCGSEAGRNRNTSAPPTGIMIADNLVGRHPAHALAQGRGIILTGTLGAVVSGNVISETVSCGLWFQEDHHGGVPPADKLRCRGVVCTGNVLRRVGQVSGKPGKPKHAIRLIGVEDSEITGNVSIDHGDRLIRANRVRNTDWSGNRQIDAGVIRIELVP